MKSVFSVISSKITGETGFLCSQSCETSLKSIQIYPAQRCQFAAQFEEVSYRFNLLFHRNTKLGHSECLLRDEVDPWLTSGWYGATVTTRPAARDQVGSSPGCSSSRCTAPLRSRRSRSFSSLERRISLWYSATVSLTARKISSAAAVNLSLRNTLSSSSLVMFSGRGGRPSVYIRWPGSGAGGTAPACPLPVLTAAPAARGATCRAGGCTYKRG